MNVRERLKAYGKSYPVTDSEMHDFFMNGIPGDFDEIYSLSDDLLDEAYFRWQIEKEG